MLCSSIVFFAAIAFKTLSAQAFYNLAVYYEALNQGGKAFM